MPLSNITRGKLAELSGCNSETIRYFERIGLLPEPIRGDNGYRYYDGSQLARLRFIIRAKQLGFSNHNISDLLEISDGVDQRTRAEVKTLTLHHLDSVRQRISDLRKMEKTLREISSQCDGAKESVDHCPILLSLFSGGKGDGQ